MLDYYIGQHLIPVLQTGRQVYTLNKPGYYLLLLDSFECLRKKHNVENQDLFRYYK